MSRAAIDARREKADRVSGITPTAACLGAELGSVSAHDVARATGWELAKSGRTAIPVRGVGA